MGTIKEARTLATSDNVCTCRKCGKSVTELLERGRKRFTVIVMTEDKGVFNIRPIHDANIAWSGKNCCVTGVRGRKRRDRVGAEHILAVICCTNGTPLDIEFSLPLHDEMGFQAAKRIAVRRLEDEFRRVLAAA